MSEMKHSFLLYSNSLSSATPTELGNFIQMSSKFQIYSNKLCSDVPTQVQALSSSVTSGWQLSTGNELLGKVCPTPGPTVLPTVFTHSPSVLPTTLAPSPLPTLTPTVTCASGTYLDADTGCTACSIGRYANNSAGPPFASSCDLCPMGRYNINTGQAACFECAVGKFSSEDRSSCGGECDG